MATPNSYKFRLGKSLMKSCFSCQSSCNDPPCTPLHPWNRPDKPWSRICVNFVGSFYIKMSLTVSTLNALKVYVMLQITAKDTVMQLQKLFATHGLLDTFVSDDGLTL